MMYLICVNIYLMMDAHTFIYIYIYNYIEFNLIIINNYFMLLTYSLYMDILII